MFNLDYSVDKIKEKTNKEVQDIYEELEDNDEELDYIPKDETKQKNKLVSIEELIEENTKIIIDELNKCAREAFKQGKLKFVYYIPQIIWDTQEVMREIMKCMEEAGWTFGDIKTWSQGDLKKKEIWFIICEESKGV